jgi:hypothetical protein
MVLTLPPFFPHRRNRDGSFDSICLKCLLTIGNARTEALVIPTKTLKVHGNGPYLRAEGTRMKSCPWIESRTAKQNEKRDSLEVQGNVFNLGTIWSFLNGGGQNSESDEIVK